MAKAEIIKEQELVGDKNITINALINGNKIIQKIHGDLLRIAISNQATEIVEKTLQLNNYSAKILFNDYESPLKIAVKTGSDTIIHMIKKYADLKIELELLSKLQSSNLHNYWCSTETLNSKISSCKDIDEVIEIYKSLLPPKLPDGSGVCVSVCLNDFNVITQRDKKEEQTNSLDSHKDTQKLSEGNNKHNFNEEAKAKITEYLDTSVTQLHHLHETLCALLSSQEEQQQCLTEEIKATIMRYVDTYLNQLNDLQTILQGLSEEYKTDTLTESLKVAIKSSINTSLEQHSQTILQELYREVEERRVAEEIRRTEEEYLAEVLFEQVQDIEYYHCSYDHQVTSQGLVLDNPFH